MKTGLLPAIAIHSIAVLISAALYFSDDTDHRDVGSTPEITRHQETFQQRAERTPAAALIKRATAYKPPE
jgi:hypothetical protein